MAELARQGYDCHVPADKQIPAVAFCCLVATALDSPQLQFPARLRRYQTSIYRAYWPENKEAYNACVID
jgi:hypothetical protein